MKTYQEVSQIPFVLQISKAALAWDLLIASGKTADEDFQELLTEFVTDCVKYANVRGNWNLLTQEEKRATDNRRTQLHNLVVSGLNILERYLKSQGKDTSFREIVGRSAEGQERKRQGDFACFVAYVSGISGR